MNDLAHGEKGADVGEVVERLTDDVVAHDAGKAAAEMVGPDIQGYFVADDLGVGDLRAANRAGKAADAVFAVILVERCRSGVAARDERLVVAFGRQFAQRKRVVEQYVDKGIQTQTRYRAKYCIQRVDQALNGSEVIGKFALHASHKTALADDESFVLKRCFDGFYRNILHFTAGDLDAAANPSDECAGGE